jgi:hypothetical protein
MHSIMVPYIWETKSSPCSFSTINVLHEACLSDNGNNFLIFQVYVQKRWRKGYMEKLIKEGHVYFAVVEIGLTPPPQQLI